MFFILVMEISGTSAPFKHGSQTVLFYRVCTKESIPASPLCSNRPGIDGITGACHCYPGGYMPTTCFITSTFRGQMTITMGYQNSRRTRAGTHNVVHLFEALPDVDRGRGSGTGDPAASDKIPTVAGFFCPAHVPETVYPSSIWLVFRFLANVSSWSVTGVPNHDYGCIPPSGSCSVV